MSDTSAQRVYESATPVPRDRAGRTVVLLNANAKRVSERVRRDVAQVAPDADIFYTQSLEEAEFVHRRVADLGYDHVFLGGGDGTVVHTIDQVCRRLDENGFPYPRFGVLKLGTGNGIADFFGADDFRTDLQRAPDLATRQLHLMEVDGGVRAPFFGFGWDAYILNNYDLLKRQAQRFAWSRALFKTALGYLIAGVGKSVPEFIVKRPVWNIRVVNTGAVGYQLDRKGEVVERYGPGALVYEGPCRLGCFGTTPFYGFKFRMMPFADKTPGMFHFRVIDMPPLAAVAQLPRAWVGRLDHPRLFDFQLTGCRVEFDREAPFQIGGDAKGTRQGLEVSMHPRPIPCVAFGR